MPVAPSPPAVSADFAPVFSLLATGWIDGQSPNGQLGGEVRAGLARSRLSFGILGVFGPGADISDGLTTVKSARQLAALWGSAGLFLSQAWRVDLGVRAGAALFTRRTVSAEPVVVASDPSTVWSAVAGAMATLQWQER